MSDVYGIICKHQSVKRKMKNRKWKIDWNTRKLEQDKLGGRNKDALAHLAGPHSIFNFWQSHQKILEKAPRKEKNKRDSKLVQVQYWKEKLQDRRSLILKMIEQDNQTIEERTTISDVFLELNLDRDVRIIDVACGIGIVAEDLAKHGYTNIDGLDPSKGYIEVAKSKGLYKVSRSVLFYKSDLCVRKAYSLSVICSVGKSRAHWGLIR